MVLNLIKRSNNERDIEIIFNFLDATFNFYLFHISKNSKQVKSAVKPIIIKEFASASIGYGILKIADSMC